MTSQMKYLYLQGTVSPVTRSYISSYHDLCRSPFSLELEESGSKGRMFELV